MLADHEPELLVALFTAKNAPAEVQLLSEHTHSPDNTTAYLSLKNTGGKTSILSLWLHRSSDGWRLMVPAHAVEKIG